jgi:flagellar biosynthesis protein FlhG
VASGKGGTGKSVVTASLAHLMASRGRTLIVDADMGVGNAHILQDVKPRRSFVDVVGGHCEVVDTVTPCAERLDLLSAGSGVSRMAGLSAYELHLISGGLAAIETDYDFLLVDSAAGISEQTVAFAAACDVVLVVTTPDPTAMTDAYAFIKVLVAKRPGVVPLVVVNRVDESEGSERELSGERVAARIAHVCLKFLGMEPRWVGSVPEDRAVIRSVGARRPVVTHAPGSPSAVALQALSVPVLGDLELVRPGGLGQRLVDAAGFVDRHRRR